MVRLLSTSIPRGQSGQRRLHVHRHRPEGQKVTPTWQSIRPAAPAVTSKAALIRFTENLALENREHGVRVFPIHPGTARTAMATGGIDSPAGRLWLP